jgi:hypothetical protein
MLGVERPDRLAVGVERFPLSSSPIQGEHELAAQALAQRLAGHEPLELADELGTPAHRQIGLDAVLDCGRTQILQAGDLGRRERLERHVGQRRAAPLLERRPQSRRRALGAAGRQCTATILA